MALDVEMGRALLGRGFVGQAEEMKSILLQGSYNQIPSAKVVPSLPLFQ